MGEVSVQGKPTIFFSANASDEAWRFKEKIVAVIGSFLQGRDDLYTFSSISVRDIAEDSENLDVAYANLDDPTDLFSFIEVRDREEKVGRQYIQEIMGKKASLAIEACEIVSTKGFTRNAIRLASKVGIPLRLLVPETNADTKSWFNPNHIGLLNLVAVIDKCSIIAKLEGGFQEFEADQSKSRENNVLVPTETPGTYKVVSLAKIFDVEVIRDKEHSERILSSLPSHNEFHKATVAVEYKDKATYYMHVKDVGIVPVAAMVFFVSVNNQAVDAPIDYRYAYIDAVSEERLADVVCASALVGEIRYYTALVRHACGDQNCRLGGAFFR